MQKTLASNYSKVVIITLGVVCAGYALFGIPGPAFSWGYVICLLLSIFVAPRMSISLPRSKFAVSFSDALIFLTFLLYGGKAAILLAAIEMLAHCLYIQSSGYQFRRWMIPTNVAINTVTTACTYFAWRSIPLLTGVELNPSHTQHLISILGLLAITQFFVSTALAAIFQSLKEGTNLFTTWTKDCFTSSMTQIVGAGIAGLSFKVINFGDPVTGGIAAVAFIIAYLTYKQSIAEINTAIGQAEEAERQKADTERERRREAERHASQLSRSLEMEEKANLALRKSKRDFQHAALHDSLTTLANRKQLGDILKRLIDDYKEDPSVTFHVLFLDIRKFKNINDSLGHTIGDKVLMIAAKRFVRMLSSIDTVARIGGDEFAIILRNLSSAAKAQKVARRIYRSISQPFSLRGNRISISVNIGIAPCDTEYDTPEEILRDADIAMHYAREKNSGVAVFSTGMRDRFLERARFELDLRHAVERDELSLVYQPIVSLVDGHLVGFEALLRWHHGEEGVIPPSKFIPVAEESGLIIPMTEWILQQTCSQLSRWHRMSPDNRNLIVSVNISGRHLSTDDLVDDVEHALAAAELSPHLLKLEITESSAMENANHTINILHRLKQLGVQLSIDDFGTGYSSLSYLHRLPFDTLKIDRSFVYRVGEHGENSEILQTIISLAKNLKMRVIAEGIETESQLRLLKNLGCDYGQGYLLAKPQPAEEAEKLIYRYPKWLPIGEGDDYQRSPNIESDDSLPVF
jgi:diguanylate cyclase (GGDEF)-like protein